MNTYTHGYYNIFEVQNQHVSIKYTTLQLFEK